MNRLVARWLPCFVIGAAIVRCPGFPAAPPAGSVPASTDAAAAEREACARNLKTLYAAIQAYQADQHDLPNWLSDLFPKYIPDANVLICPACRRTGETESAPLADPKLPSSYLFEFCPVPLGGAAPNAPGRTRRDWKRRQMGLVGSIVPIIRCRHHDPVLNVAFDGTLYDSPPMWEALVTNRLSLADLSAAQLFAHEPAQAVKSQPKTPVSRFPARDASAGKEVLDLTAFYNAALRESWHGRTDNTLAALPTGLQVFGGIQFDVRGIVQLGSKSESVGKFPAQVRGITVRQKCAHLHFLHSTGFGSTADEGKTIGSYLVHYASQNMRLEIPIVYGRDVRNWHSLPGEAAPGPPLRLGWMGENAVTLKAGTSLRLFISTWTNPASEVEVESIDYVSSMGQAAPFLIAVTADFAQPKSASAGTVRTNVQPAQSSSVAAQSRPVTNAALPRQTPMRESGSPSASRAEQASAVPIKQWFMIGGAGVLGMLLLVWTMRRRRGAAAQPRVLLPVAAGGTGTASYTVVPQCSLTASASEPSQPPPLPQPMIHLPREAATQTKSDLWTRPVLPAGAGADVGAREARVALRTELAHWLKQKFVRKLLADRAGLMETQSTATSKLKSVEERVARVEVLLQGQNRAYEQRIQELTRELLSAREENRELLRARIAQVKAEMEAARARLLAQAEEKDAV